MRAVEDNFAPDLRGLKGIIFFDGNCRFCRWALKKILARDDECSLKLCNVRSLRGRALMEAYGHRPESTFGLLTQHSLHFDVDAYEVILNGPAQMPLPAFLVNQIPRRMSNFFYGKIASNRAALSSLIPSSADLTFPAERYIVGGE
jgi:predicted DCC family thiol-disulfide oxidoreductase YuxK